MKIPHHLVEAAKSKELLLFLGAGASVNAGLPDWRGLVINLLEHSPHISEHPELLIKNIEANFMSPLDVLDRLVKFRHDIYAFLENCISGRRESPLHNLMGNVSSKFVTTNFDTLIEDNTGIASKNVTDYTGTYKLAKIAGEKEFVLKLHGDINRLDDCLLFSDDYAKVYQEDNLARFQFSKLVTSNKCLFVGFSFTDPYVLEMFDHLDSIYQGLSNHLFLIGTEKPHLPYIDDIIIEDHSQLWDFFEQVVREVDAEVPTVVSAEMETIVDQRQEFKLATGVDSPPEVEHWVGRVDELLRLENDFKVTFITGLGGQGKSALAAQYIKSVSESGSYGVDWRDFKEEDHNFQSKIITMIQTVSDSEIGPESLLGRYTDELVDIFFSVLGRQRCIFVFDNIDRYIDFEKSIPLPPMLHFFNRALQMAHNSKFIFTCRQFINHADTNFFQLRLQGLTLDDILDLADKYRMPVSSTKKRAYAERILALTQGHALWINLILAHSGRGGHPLEQLIGNLEHKKNVLLDPSIHILSETILKEAWETLNRQQKIILRTLAESISSVDESDLANILKREMSNSRFNRSISVLKNLNWLVYKASSCFVELHPLVRTFIKNRFLHHEQKRFISMLVSHLGRTILILKVRLNDRLTFEEYKNWSDSIELNINARDYNDALTLLLEIHESMRVSGYTEEYIRLTLCFLNAIDWNRNTLDSLKYFNRFFQESLETAIEFGDRQCLEYLERYESLAAGSTGPESLLLLSCALYEAWFNKRWDDAIKMGQHGEYLLKKSGQEDDYNIIHRLHLAYRDSGIPENLEKAFEYFRNGENLCDICDKKIFPESMAADMYGNIGKCFMLKRDFDPALVCLLKSYYLLLVDVNPDRMRMLNLGYASKWLFTILRQLGFSLESLYFLRRANGFWHGFSPPLINSDPDFKELDASQGQQVMGLEQWEVEKFCDSWVKGRLGIDF